MTTLVLITVLLTGSGLLLALQAVVFALGAVGGLRRSPYGWLYRTLVRPRPAPPTEDERPPRFAQGVGLAFAAVGTLGFLTGVAWLGLLATGFALAAAFLNTVFGYCLGCEVYPLVRRAQGRLDTVA
ncbi:DUF4395 domain-containing protein [Streptomyces sp. CB01881]|nr:DUF4395 domain-containing protein [Streptomyces sp. CB01881]TYC77206.1 DUF4395 domain-containing protein [Streptomyces sp. CB01881]